MTRQRFLSLSKIALTLAILVASIWYTIGSVNFSELGDSFRHADYRLALLLLPISFLSHWVRAVRWRVMLSSLAIPVRLGDLFGSTMIGYFLSNIISRSGEVVRPYILSQRERDLPFSSLLGSIIVERFIDSIALLLIVASVLVFDRGLLSGFAQYQGAVRALLYPALALGLAFILIAPSTLGMRLARTVTSPLPERFKARILDVFAKLQAGFGVIKSGRQLLLVIVYTFVIYFLYMIPSYIMFFAVPSGLNASPTLFDGMRMLAITAMAVAVAPTPGAFGVYHAAARAAAIQLLAFTYADAVAYGTIIHFMQFMVIIVFGGYYLITMNLSVKQLLSRRQ
jgi:glycosyltransferase 2 family protein